MSIKKLEEYRDMFISDEDITDVYISNFMSEMIDTFKDQSDMIAELQKELAKKMKEIDQKESYYPKKEVVL
jgi:hypothetical protein